MQTLTALLWTPAVGAVLVALMPQHRVALIRNFSLAVVVLSLLIAWRLPFQFNSGLSSMQFFESRSWNPEMGSFYALGVDGIALPMVLLATLLSVISMLASRELQARVKGYHVCLLLLEFGMLGVFMAQDWALFYVFWEVTLIPLFFLIDQWGGSARHTASLNFVLYTMGGSVFLLIALLAVYSTAEQHSTAFSAMRELARALPADQQQLIFLGLLIGFGVKLPSFPLHGWLPLAHVEAPSPVSILLSGILLKMGAYGLIRSMDMLPLAAAEMAPWLAGLGLVSIVYGGILAWRQTDLKAMVAYSSVSHMGLVMLGLSTLTDAGILGATLQMSAHGLLAGILFLLVGLLYQRTHTREIGDYGALLGTAPRFALFLTLALLAALGLPGTAGFTAELHALIGSFSAWGWWSLAVSLTVLVSGAYAIRTISRFLLGAPQAASMTLTDLRGFELTAAGLLTVGLLGLGILPETLVDLMSASVNSLRNGIVGSHPPTGVLP